MGGCRCSYKNCKIRSDGKTHLFHYPVFDKLRCHKWITNAQKLEFLNLKVSQLKNRVVCQHHFKDEYFMNFKKDKLTCNAVPTENGPYCDTSQCLNVKSEKDSSIYNISLEDIEDISFIDKKANFSVKYGDFLTNTDLMDTNVTEKNHISTKDKQSEAPLSRILNKNFEMLYPRIGKIEVEIENIDTAPVEAQKPASINSTSNVNETHSKESKEDSTKEKKVVILSEKKITDAAQIPLPPKPLLKKGNIILNAPADQIAIRRGHALSLTVENNSKVDVPAPVENKILNNDFCQEAVVTELPKVEQELIENVPTAHCKVDSIPEVIINNNVVSESRNSKSLLKRPLFLTPEQRAMIQEKRNFNMKLRDIIETCLDNLDSEEKTQENNNTINNNVPNPPFELNKLNSARKHFKKKKEVSGVTRKQGIQEYGVTYLEAKMKKMEENLVKKIEQNKKQIMELKNEIKKAPHTSDNQIQMFTSEEAHKKHLYSQLSKYLSADANNLIYEELFINKFGRTSTDEDLPLVKRRRLR